MNDVWFGVSRLKYAVKRMRVARGDQSGSKSSGPLEIVVWPPSTTSATARRHSRPSHVVNAMCRLSGAQSPWASASPGELVTAVLPVPSGCTT